MRHQTADAAALRDLQDVVMHAVSEIVVQVGALEAIARSQRLDLGEGLPALGRAARTAMADLRQMHALLNSGRAVPYGPVPGLGALADLLDDHRDDGLDIAVSLPDDTAAVVPSVALAAFRIVHAVLTALGDPPHDAALTIDAVAEHAALRLTVTVRSAEPLVEPFAVALAAAGRRARAHGGAATASALSDGAWRLVATLPMEDLP